MQENILKRHVALMKFLAIRDVWQQFETMNRNFENN
jgi:hypothetical protein